MSFQGISIAPTTSTDAAKTSDMSGSGEEPKTIDLEGCIALDEDDDDEAPDLMHLLDDDNWMDQVIALLISLVSMKESN